MSIQTTYKKRPIRFLEVHEQDEWKIKIYSISRDNEYVHIEVVALAKTYLTLWLQKTSNYALTTYKLATLILHEGKEGCFAIINWWIDENMLQNHVYLLENGKTQFVEYSNRGIMACVWELEVIWFERNKWVQHILKKASNPNYNKYLQQHLNKY